MEDSRRSDFVTRDSVMRLLSDCEARRVCVPETPGRLSTGEEYLDLDRLEQGVQRAWGGRVDAGQVLPRAAVEPSTWNDILAELVGCSPSRRLEER